jgi:hypothetical protein
MFGKVEPEQRELEGQALVTCSKLELELTCKVNR